MWIRALMMSSTWIHGIITYNLWFYSGYRSLIRPPVPTLKLRGYWALGLSFTNIERGVSIPWSGVATRLVSQGLLHWQSNAENLKCNIAFEEIMILRLVGRTQPKSRGLCTPLFVSQSILPRWELILRPILRINLSLRGYWDQRSCVILQVHLGF